MESNMRKIMAHSWTDWLKESGDTHDTPSVFADGFEYCHNILMPLLIEAMPHVYASAGAAHLTDGFRPQRRKIDDLVERIEAVLPE